MHSMNLTSRLSGLRQCDPLRNNPPPTSTPNIQKPPHTPPFTFRESAIYDFLHHVYSKETFASDALLNKLIQITSWKKGT